ncbi:MAG: YfhO family protein, partial [Oscillospiraceae bacterium]|nr:YfhO family protein [Oscillospiraceae bacterium]
GLAVAAIPYLWHSAEQISEGRFHCGWRIFLLLAAAVLLDPINTVWHTGSYQAFPFRWGMIPVLLLLGCAADRLSDCADRQKAGASRLFLCVLLILLASGGVFAVICYAGDDAFAYVRTLWVSLTQFAWLLIPAAAAAGGYYLIMRLRHDGRLSAALCTALMIPLFLGETLLSFHCYVGNAGGEDAQYENTFSAADAIRDDRFFRLSMASKYLHPNMIGAMGYPTLAHYTSLTRDDYLHGIKRFGYSSYWMEVTGSGGTALSDALWANRHLIGGNADLPPWTEKAWTDGRYVIGKSRLTLPTALLTDAAPEEIASLPEGSRAQVQAYLADRLLGEPELITEYVPTETAHLTLTQTETETAAQLGSADQTGIIEYELPIRGRQALYFDLSAPTDTQLSMPYFKSVTVLFNGETVSEDYPSKSTNGLLYLGTAEDSLCTVRIEVHKDFSCESFGVFGLDLNKLEAAAARAKGAEFTCENCVYTAALQTDHPQTVIFSAAYDEGFTA